MKDTSTKIQFSIEGMHCGSCAAGIKMVLDNTEGVLHASANWESKSGEVEFDEEKIQWEDIHKAIEELGYKATPKG